MIQRHSGSLRSLLTLANTPPHSLEEPTPVSLLDALRKEDAVAWGRLVELWTPLLYHYCERRGFSSHDSDDISQSVMLRVYKGLPGFHRDGAGKRFRFWITKILRNEIADFCTQKADRPAPVGGSDYQTIVNNLPEIDFESESDSITPGQIMARALEVIKGDFQEKNWQAFELVEFKKLTNQEAAEQLGMSANAVRQATFRIRQRIKEELDGMLD